ncbi:MAG TPA: SDR family NAD(P)-dependent oxidoreductase [Acidimicrobiales bacterium]|nr:SDR family NAD(P)-dependent oxidoreductase [Acidimicrobiales bacterium]
MQTVLITGASSGMGKETAEKLLGEGYTVYAAARRVEKMRDLERIGASILAMDITNEEEVRTAVRRIDEEAGGVDVLINNAGFGLYGAMEDIPIDEARYQFEVNLLGPALLTQLVLPHMREQGAGKILNVSSMGGKIYTPLGSWYHASKHALEGWSDCLRLELKGFGIDVIIIEPGVIDTEFGDVMVEPMLKRSGSGAYAELADRVARATVANYAPGKGSPPSLIAGVISKAIRARRPHTRYVAGRYARLMIGLRHTFGDRVFDRVVMRAYR